MSHVIGCQARLNGMAATLWARGAGLKRWQLILCKAQFCKSACLSAPHLNHNSLP